MIFTRATLADLPAIAELEAEGFDHGLWSDEAWREELEAADRHVLVARSAGEGEVLGVATFQAVVDVADLHRVIVRAERRGQGIGRRLVRAGIDWAAAVGASRMMLEVEVDNSAARALYDHLGFGLVARRRDYYGEGRDALVLSRDLESTWRDIA